MPVDFVAIDFETANRSPASACQVGLIRIRDGKVVDSEDWLIQPPEGHNAFAPFNVKLHGISAARVRTAPDWPNTLGRILDFVRGDVLVAHNAPFDMGVLVAATRACHMQVPQLRYFCSLRLARKSYALPSYSLPNASRAAGYTLHNHHDALADAEACAAIVVDVSHTRGRLNIDELSKVTGVQIKSLRPSDPPMLDSLVAGATF
ncbi:exonuclease domain-containing protein [Gulosibacter chungangensis]|uniref:DNA polymerase III subunit epsilon n=1 Tax=Gulosibacter chungangensis TaxID=979746 RepID=A0A7J5BB04_9MICO|nr:exonuclease domain-containing protein [Gulosibacter chungangensis]KAB1643272.1 DNA polymerase III subunit epsilon [Gulosibacter chungangensis]